MLASSSLDTERSRYSIFEFFKFWFYSSNFWFD